MKSFHEIVLGRRTCKDFDGREVPKAHIEKLLEWATRAPNHHLNEPWRFRVLESSGVSRWIHHLESKLSHEELLPLKGSLERVKKVGAIIFVGVQKNNNPVLERENYAAACAAVQNILLGASSLEISSFWSTNRLVLHPETLTFLEWPEEENFVAAVWLGYGPQPELRARRRFEELTRWWS